MPNGNDENANQVGSHYLLVHRSSMYASHDKMSVTLLDEFIGETRHGILPTLSDEKIKSLATATRIPLPVILAP